LQVLRAFHEERIAEKTLLEVQEDVERPCKMHAG
jgi:hypothetical protein